MPPERPPLAPSELIDNARAGDLRALEMLIGHCQDAVGRFVVAQLGAQHDCVDVCQIIFVKMMHALPRLRSADVFEPWLFQLARNACIDALRVRQQRERHFVPLAPEHFEHAELATAAPDALEPLRAALAQLDEGQRKLLALSLEAPRSYTELARMTGLSIAAVKNRLFRGRERLRQLVKPGGEP